MVESIKLYIPESFFEKEVIESLKTFHGFIHKGHEDILLMRKKRSEVILWDQLREAVEFFNRHIKIDDDTWDKIKFKIQNVQHSSLTVGNQSAHRFLIDGVPIKNSVTKMTENIKLVDFNNPNKNKFIVTEQFVIIPNKASQSFKVPDLVIYLNGLPVVVFELKSPSSYGEEVISNAFQQIKNYQTYCPSLFYFNVFNVISDRHTNKYGSLTADLDRYCFWKAEDSSNRQEDNFSSFLKLLFEPKTFLNLLKNYIFFTNEQEIKKIIASYHQFYAVEKTKQSILSKINRSDSESKKGGIFWHTQGSGKTYSMVFLVRNIINVERNLTTLIVSDRNNLDEQMSSVFNKAQKYLGQEIIPIKNRASLGIRLKNRQQNGIFLCTIHKFADETSLLSKRQDILVIADEAHRSHRDADNYHLIKKNDQVITKFSYAFNLRKSLPNAMFLGFTATPIMGTEHNTKNVFGDYITTYLMNQADKDGFVVPINYECRQADLHLNTEQLSNLNETIDEIHEKYIRNSPLATKAIANLNKQIQKIELIVGDDDRIKMIAKDFIHHYEERKNILKGKAMFVAFNRQIAFKYYKQIIKQAPHLEKNIRLIITGNPRYDTPELSKIIGDKQFHLTSAQEFKNPNSEFKIVIVVNKWLTGFDVPCLDTLYIDKPLKTHNLMQTVARVNRVYTDEKNYEIIKFSGLIVDYIGIWKKLQEAFQIYLSPSKDNWQATSEIKKEILKQLELIYSDSLFGITPINYKEIFSGEYSYEFIKTVQNIVLKNNKKQNFVTQINRLRKLYVAAISQLSKETNKEIKLLILASACLIKEELALLDVGKDVRRLKILIEEAIEDNEFILISPKSDNIPFVLKNILKYVLTPISDENKSLTLYKRVCALRSGIEKLKRTNMIRGKKYSQKLEALMKKYENPFKEYKLFLVDLQNFAKLIIKDNQEGPKGLSPKELAFYEIISDNKYTQNTFDQKKVKIITLELFQSVQKLVKECPNWFASEGIKSEVRTSLKKLLKKHNYPPIDQKKLKDQLLNQLLHQTYFHFNQK